MMSVEEQQAYEKIISELRAVQQEIEELIKTLGDDDGV